MPHGESRFLRKNAACGWDLLAVVLALRGASSLDHGWLLRRTIRAQFRPGKRRVSCSRYRRCGPPRTSSSAVVSSARILRSSAGPAWVSAGSAAVALSLANNPRMRHRASTHRRISVRNRGSPHWSRDRVDELFDMLLSSDMACGGARRNMGQRKRPENPGTSEEPTP